jgi:CRISPR-associated protein Csa1
MVYFIGDELRREFIEMRDEAINVIHNNMDPGKPPTCPSYCIYYNVCNG